MKKGNSFLQKKVQAFTITELLVVLILTSIVISMTMLIYLKIESYLRNELLSKVTKTNQSCFLNQFVKEINESGSVKGDEYMLHIFLDSTLDVKYYFSSANIIRVSHLAKDTITMDFVRLTVRYTDEVPDLIGSIDLSLGKDSIDQVMITKTYAPDKIINAIINPNYSLKVKAHGIKSE